MNVRSKPELEAERGELGLEFVDITSGTADLVVCGLGVTIDTTETGSVFFSEEDLVTMLRMVRGVAMRAKYAEL
jgi:hypothetical protein